MIVDYFKHLIAFIDDWLVGLTFFGLLKTDDDNADDEEIGDRVTIKTPEQRSLLWPNHGNHTFKRLPYK